MSSRYLVKRKYKNLSRYQLYKKEISGHDTSPMFMVGVCYVFVLVSFPVCIFNELIGQTLELFSYIHETMIIGLSSLTLKNMYFDNDFDEA